MKLIVELFYVEFRFKAFEKDSFFKSFHRSEEKIEFGLILTQILQKNVICWKRTSHFLIKQ